MTPHVDHHHSISAGDLGSTGWYMDNGSDHYKNKLCCTLRAQLRNYGEATSVLLLLAALIF